MEKNRNHYNKKKKYCKILKNKCFIKIISQNTVTFDFQKLELKKKEYMSYWSDLFLLPMKNHVYQDASYTCFDIDKPILPRRNHRNTSLFKFSNKWWPSLKSITKLELRFIEIESLPF